VAEYKFWGLGAVIMFVTAIIFGTIYAFPSRTIVNDPGKLSPKERAIIYGSGPMLSFGVFVFFLLLTPIGGTVATIALLACSMNLLTAVYSFMPFVPMDGSHVLKWKRPVWALIFLPMLALYIVMTVFVF
jgi:Zn-dependent protease